MLGPDGARWVELPILDFAASPNRDLLELHDFDGVVANYSLKKPVVVNFFRIYFKFSFSYGSQYQFVSVERPISSGLLRSNIEVCSEDGKENGKRMMAFRRCWIS